MAEENSGAMNPNLSHGQGLGPISRSVNVEALQRINEEVHAPHELNHILANSGDGVTLEDGEGSSVTKTSLKMDGVKKGSGNEENFFKCIICLDLAKEPIVTPCGHLFCWPCIYQWLDVHSNSKKCPVCKRDVILKNVTPIYGRGTNAHVREDKDSDLGIPSRPRPQARRVGNLREALHLNEFPLLVKDILLRMGGGRTNLIQYLSQLLESNNHARRELVEMPISVLRMFMSSEGITNELISRARRRHDAVSLLNNNDGRGGRNQERPPSSNDASRVPGVDGGDQAPRGSHLD